MADPGVVDTVTTATVAAGDSATVTLTWASDETTSGEFSAAGDVGADTDSQTVRVARVESADTDEWALPIEPGSDATVGLPAGAVTTDHETIDITSRVGDDALYELSHYRAGDDIQRVETAYGAFRRLPRDGSDAVSFDPPEELSPPFESRPVVPLGLSAQEIAPDTHDVQVTLGLVDPRAREPIEASSPPETIGSKTTQTVAPGSTITTTVSGDAPDVFGDYIATVDVGRDSDDTVVTVEGGPLFLSFPAASFALTREQIGQPQREIATGRERVTLPLRLSVEEATDLLAVGSRVPAASTRQVPDGPNQTRDTLPDEELTADVSATIPLVDVGGTMVLVGWSLERSRPGGPLPYDATITLVDTDA